MEVSPNIIEIKTNSDMHKYCSAITKHKVTVVDTETTGLNPHVNKPILFQIGTDKIQYVIHWYRVSLEPLRKYLESGDILKIFQFHTFDYKFIKTHAHIEIDTNIFDTALAELVLKGGLEKLQGGVNLETLSLKYLDLQLDKSIRKLFEYWTPNIKIDRNMIEYSAYDLIAPYHIHSIQKKLLVANNLTATAQLEFDASSAIGDMELNGMYLDSNMWAGLDVNATNNKMAAKDILDSYFHDVCNIDLFGKPLINYDSSEQLLSVLKKKGLPLPNTDARTLKMNRSHEIIPTVEEHRKWAKATSTYGIDFLKHINPVTKRVHTSYWQILATGRLSSEKPNLQNIIADIKYREPFRAQHEGESILTIDYAGCELRILAELSQDPVLLKAFEDELITNIEADPHSTIGTLMLGIPMSKTVNADKRKQMKSLIFGLVYGMGYNTLSVMLNVSIKEAKSLVKQYFKTLPGIKKYLNVSAANAIARGYSVTLGGRRRYFLIPKLQDLVDKLGYADGKDKYDKTIGYIERQGKNSPIQGTNGDIIKKALVELRRDIKKNQRKTKIINTVHDEVIFEGADMHEYMPIAINIMNAAQAHFLRSVPPRVSATNTSHWSK